jgi:hypothetical protein
MQGERSSNRSVLQVSEDGLYPFTKPLQQFAFKMNGRYRHAKTGKTNATMTKNSTNCGT